MSQPEPDRRRIPGLLVAVLCLGAGLRLLWMSLATRLPAGAHDPARYLIHALQLADGEGYVRPDDGRPTAYYPVGYPLVLSGLFRVVSWFYDPERPTSRALYESAWRRTLGDHAESLSHLVDVAVLAQILLGVLTIYLVYALGRALAGVRAGLVAASVVAVFPNLVYHSGVLLTETLFGALTVGALAVVITPPWTTRPPGIGRWLAFGGLLGIAALVRPVALVWLGLVPVVLWLAQARARQLLAATACAGLAALAVLTPWTLRNVRVMGAPILVSTNLGENLCVGHHRNAPGHFVMPPVCVENSLYGKPDVNPTWEVQRNRDLRDRALEFALEHPAAEFALLFDKLYFLVWHDHNAVAAAESYGKDEFFSETTRDWLEGIADGYFYVVLAIGLAGFVWMLRPPLDPRRVAIVLAALSIVGVPLLFFGHPRFHVPASPLLAIGLALLVTPGAGRRVGDEPPTPDSSHTGRHLGRSL